MRARASAGTEELAGCRNVTRREEGGVTLASSKMRIMLPLVKDSSSAFVGAYVYSARTSQPPSAPAPLPVGSLATAAAAAAAAAPPCVPSDGSARRCC